VNTRLLAERWAVDPRTVLRVCRFHHIPEIRLRDGGRILYSCEKISALERQIFGRN
jgi:hypothetical protein